MLGVCAEYLNKMDKKIIEQIKIVEHYMNNMDEYPVINNSFFEGLKATKLKNKSKSYVNKINDLIDERIDNGKVAFHKKYGIT